MAVAGLLLRFDDSVTKIRARCKVAKLVLLETVTPQITSTEGVLTT